MKTLKKGVRELKLICICFTKTMLLLNRLWVCECVDDIRPDIYSILSESTPEQCSGGDFDVFGFFCDYQYRALKAMKKINTNLNYTASTFCFPCAKSVY